MFVFISLFSFSFSSIRPRHVCEDSVRAWQAEGVRQHLSVELGPTATRTLQRGAGGAASIRRSQRFQSSHEPWRATHRNGQQYVTKATNVVLFIFFHFSLYFCPSGSLVFFLWIFWEMPKIRSAVNTRVFTFCLTT